MTMVFQQMVPKLAEFESKIVSSSSFYIILQFIDRILFLNPIHLQEKASFNRNKNCECLVFFFLPFSS